MHNKNKIIHSHKKKTIKEIFNEVIDSIKGIRARFFVILAVIALIPLIVFDNLNRYYYSKSMINKEIASIQTKTAVISDEVSKYDSVDNLRKSSMVSRIIRYSALDNIRIRIINTDFLVVTDSYSEENGRYVINSNAINGFNTGKKQSSYNRRTGTIEAVSPVTDKDGKIFCLLIIDYDISELNTFEHEVSDKTNLIKAAIIVSVIALALMIVRLFGKSLKGMFKTIEEIANGHIEKRLPENKGYTEVKRFAKNFNSIMDKASTLDETRQEFVSNVSHELKTPITSIKVLADSLNMQEDVPIELYKEFMQDITNEIDRESKIIDDLLSLVKLDKKAEALNITPVNLNELLEIVLKRLKPIAQKKNIEILFESFRPVVAEVDEVKMTQVISNLVENAIKYNEIDGSVHVSLNADYQYFYIKVQDTGIGIPKESQEMVFERFYRVDKARSRQTGGTGLGLAIVKNIVLMHHGTIKLYSEENKGTIFTVRIPLNYIE